MKILYVVIVTYNSGPEIGGLLDRLVQESQQVKGSSIHILVVDNASTDSSTQNLLSEREGSTTIHVIRNEKNRGFAAGCNTGIHYALSHHADAVLLVNPDTEIPEGFFRAMLDETSDISAPVIRFQRKGKWIYDYGGIVNTWTGETRHGEYSVIASPQAWRSRRLAESSDGIASSQTPRNDMDSPIDYVSGCCMMIRKNVFDTIGFFDERYFLYFEDVDFCLRAKRVGLNVSVVSAAVVNHALKEGNEKSWVKHRAHLMSALTFINSWIPLYRRPVAYGYWILLVLKTLFNVVSRHAGLSSI